jgi:ligand-binding sensor domain-containing protein
MIIVPLLFASSSALTLKPGNQAYQYMHSAWRLSAGPLPGDPNAMTQTTDGYLWVGTNNELKRFDGVRFTEWSPRAGRHFNRTITSLLCSSAGSL